MRKVFDDKGFTLIELMMVVAIIGLLAAIAIPNFLVYKARAAQAEASSNLGAIFTDEQGFYSNNDRYSDDLMAIGAAVSGTAKRYDFTVTAQQDNGDGTISPIIGSWIGKHGTPGNGPAAGTTINLDSLPGAGVSTFTAIAVGDIDGDVDNDTWSMNEQARLKNDWNDTMN